MARRNRKREPLSRDRVLRSAMDLADTHGLTALSMRKLGQQLGVEAMSLYNHVANKDDLLSGLIDLFVSELAMPSDADGWKQALRAIALDLRAALRRHPWASVLLESHASANVTRTAHHDAILGVLRRSGISIALAQKTQLALDSYVYGFALQESSWPLDETELPDAVEASKSELSLEEFPYMAELLEHVGAALATGEPDAGGILSFEFGLDVLLDGLELRVLAEREGTGENGGRG